MNIPLLESRVTSLESLMADLIEVSYRTQRNVDQLSLEMREFKEESRRNQENFKEEMREFKEESRRNHENFREEMRDFKEEMKDFKDEMREFKDQSEKDRRAFNKQLGEIANKQGRMTEDLVAPGIGRILQKIVGGPCGSQDQEAIRVKRRHCITQERREFDAVVACDQYVLINETKSSLNVKDVNDFVEIMGQIRNYFPDYSSKRIIGSLATLYADPSLIKYASSKGILVLAVGDELMDIQNEPGFIPAEF